MKIAAILLLVVAVASFEVAHSMVLKDIEKMQDNRKYYTNAVYEEEQPKKGDRVFKSKDYADNRQGYTQVRYREAEEQQRQPNEVQEQIEIAKQLAIAKALSANPEIAPQPVEPERQVQVDPVPPVEPTPTPAVEAAEPQPQPGSSEEQPHHHRKLGSSEEQDHPHHGKKHHHHHHKKHDHHHKKHHHHHHRHHHGHRHPAVVVKSDMIIKTEHAGNTRNVMCTRCSQNFMIHMNPKLVQKFNGPKVPKKSVEMPMKPQAELV